MKNKFTVFYSWQSDIIHEEKKNLIMNGLERTIKKLKVKEVNNLLVILDRDTRNRSGSPSIIQTIFDKIENSDIFICDVTIINASENRLTPNPNVLIELGFAIKTLGWDRIICLNNSKVSSVENLPFDIRGHRISNFQSEDNLLNTLDAALKAIINNYTEIQDRFDNNSRVNHDRKIHMKFKQLFGEEQLFDSLNLAVNSCVTYKYYYLIWDKIIHFYSIVENRFLDQDLDKKIKEFIKSLDNFRDICHIHFFDEDKNDYNIDDLKNAGVEITEDMERDYLMNIVYSIQKEPNYKESYEDANRRIFKVSGELLKSFDIIKASYEGYILCLKEKAIIGQ